MKKAFCIFLVAFYSCTQNVEKPDNLISQEKMTQLLADIYIHQQSSYMNGVGGEPLDYARVNAHLLNEHGVNIEDFEKSYEYYLLHPDLYESILLGIREELESQLPQEERSKRKNLRAETEKSVKK